MPQNSGHEAANIFEKSLEIGRRAIDAGLFEVAFHCLSAALHCAERLDDVARAKTIGDLADETRRRIDREHPDHRIGSKAAADRGHTPLFETLGVHAKAVALRIRGVDAVAEANRASGLEKARRRTNFGHTPAGKRWYFNNLKS